MTVDSQKIVNCDNSMEQILKCVGNQMAYILRINVTNTGLNDSFYQRYFQFNMGKYIQLQQIFTQNEIFNSEVLKDVQYLKPAEMYYEGSH